MERPTDYRIRPEHPQHVIHRLTEPKRIVHRALAGIMPAEAALRARKVTPAPLYLHALRIGARETVAAHCTNMMCAERGYVDEAAFRSEMDRLQRGEIEMFNLWETLSLEMWLRRYWR